MKTQTVQNQQPTYPDAAALSKSLKGIQQAPAFTSLEEINLLRTQLAAVQSEDGFILQAGDCVERFDFMNAKHVSPRLELLSKMGNLWNKLSGVKPVLIARMGGQLFKPRSNPTEPSIWGPIPSFRGEAVHSYKKDQIARTPDPARLSKAYELIEQTCEVRDSATETQHVFFSHEALHLDWEHALTRTEGGKTFLGSSPFVWIGERTKQLDGPHIDLVRGIENVVGIKVGPTTTVDDLEEYCAAINPQNLAGKLVFILRMGLKHSQQNLKDLLQDFSERNPGSNILWTVDPMHGNKHATQNGQKFRSLFEILCEIRLHISTHEQLNKRLHGIHLESTPESVSEVLGGSKASKGVRQEQLLDGFDSYCDPRLNKHQCLELVESLAPWACASFT
jgi:3-deoxy-D-arabino-heptulosonate 7-phosphate (DAHP) synthase class II